MGKLMIFSTDFLGGPKNHFDRSQYHLQSWCRALAGLVATANDNQQGEPEEAGGQVLDTPKSPIFMANDGANGGQMAV